MKVGEYGVPDGFYYSREHEWMKIEADRCRVGLTDYAQKSLHEVVFVDLPKIGTNVSQAQSIGTVESVKAVADVFSPVSGEIVEANQNLPDKPELVNQNPYGDGWVAVIKPSNLEIEIKNLLDPKGYCEFLESIIEKK